VGAFVWGLRLLGFGPGGAAVWAGGLAALKDAGRAPIRAEHPAPRRMPPEVNVMRRGPKKEYL